MSSTSSPRVPPPTLRPAAAVTSCIAALAMVGVAVVAVRDLAVEQGWATGSTWTGWATDRLDGLTASGGVVAAGIALVVVGLWWIVLAVKPSARSHHATQLDGDVWVTGSALSAVAVSAAEQTPGVAVATARVRRRRVVVDVQSDRPDVAPAVEAAVTRQLEGFSGSPVKVSIQKVKHDS